MVSRTEPCPAPVRWLAAVLLAVALFAHGCHTGDHDDEPVVAPPRVVEAPEPETPR